MGKSNLMMFSLALYVSVPQRGRMERKKVFLFFFSLFSRQIDERAKRKRKKRNIKQKYQ
jgi:hypothetical protein